MKVRPSLLCFYVSIRTIVGPIHAHLRLVEAKEGRRKREKERDARSGERTSFTEPNVLKLGGKKRKKKGRDRVRYDKSDDERRILVNVG